eukprot:g4196.t1
MSNCETIELPKLVISRPEQVAIALQPLLHTIVFNRNLQSITSVDVFDAELGFSYVTVSDDNLSQIIQEKISEFTLWLQRRDSQSGLLKIAFHDRPIKKSSFFTEERVQSCWEQWILPITISQSSKSVSRSHFQSQVLSVMEFVLSRIASLTYPLPIMNHPLLETLKISIVTDTNTTRVLESIRRAMIDVNMPSLLR